MHLNKELKTKYNVFLISEHLDFQNLLKVKKLENLNQTFLKCYSVDFNNLSEDNLYLHNQHSTILDFKNEFNNSAKEAKPEIDKSGL